MTGESDHQAEAVAAPEAGFEQRLLPWIKAGIALKIVLLFALAWNTLFVMDEFWQLRQGQFVFDGYFDTMWPSKAVLFALFYKLAHVVGWDAVSIMLVGRIQTALLACATMALLYHCARAMGRDRLRALLVVFAMLCFSTFMERVFRTRAEPLALFFAATALFLVLRPTVLRYRDMLLAGFACGLSFLSTQKAIYFDFALGVALVVQALAARKIVTAFLRGATLVAGWALAIAAYGLLFGGTEALKVLELTFFAPIEGAVHGGEPYGSLRFFVLQTLARNVILYAACFGGLAIALIKLRSLGQAERIALVFTVVIAALVFAHNQPWPYVFIMAIPFLALWVPYLVDAAPAESLLRKAVWAVLLLGSALSFIVNVAYFRVDNRLQIETMERAEALVGPGQLFFDGSGMLVDEQEMSPWLDQAGVLATLALGEESQAYSNLETHTPDLVITSYRSEAIRPVIGPLLDARYVKVAPNLLVPGRRLEAGETVEFDVRKPGRYRTYSPDGEPVHVAIEVGGRPTAAPIQLDAGVVRVRMAGEGPAVLLVREGEYAGIFAADEDDYALYVNTY